MSKTFGMADLGLLNHYLGVLVRQTSTNIFVSQTKYAKSLLERFRMKDCKISSTHMEIGLKLSTKTDSKAVNEPVYNQLVENLIYLTTIRLDLSYTVSFISKFMIATKAKHWTTAKRVLRYARGTLDFGILYSKTKDPRLCGYTNSEWGGCVYYSKSTSRHVFSLARVQ